MVDAVTFYRYQIMLSFEDGRRIVFSAPFCFGSPSDIHSQEWAEFPIRESGVLRVLGATVADLHTDAQNQLWIDFSSGDTLLIAWMPMYECYEFMEGRERIIV